MDDDELEAELANPFPLPPSHYINYSSKNLALLALLKERTADDPNAEMESVVKQYRALDDQADVPDWPLVNLEKPRVDWILEEGRYDVFGDTWFVKENIPSLGDSGGHQLYPSDPSEDRRPALLSVLRSMLVSYSTLTSSLLKPPPPITSEVTPDWQRHVEWITVLAQNIMAAANDLRPVQARGNLESMMKRQLEVRRDETKVLHERCEVMETRLAELRASAATLVIINAPSPQVQEPNAPGLAGNDVEHLGGESDDSVLQWAGEIL